MPHLKTLVFSLLFITIFNPNISANNLSILSDSLLENVYLNEIMASNDHFLDEYGEADDWIEIYNGGTDSISLVGLYLTDDMSDLQKWQISNSSLIEANGFSLFWADGTPEQGDNHTNFKLNSSGEFLALVQEFNGELYILDSISFPESPRNISYGRIGDGQSEWGLLGEISLNSSNNGKLQYFNEPVIFSEKGGHYSAEVSLEMSVSDPIVDIYYTLDGRIPTDQDSLYQGPILLKKTNLVQARAFKTGFISPEITADFFIINDPSKLPIINVQSDPDNFWDNETGIYVKGTNGLVSFCDNVSNNWNQNWERPCQITYFEPDGTQGFQVNAGMKIGGACSRNLKMKSLNFFLRSSEYGDESIEYSIFPNSDINEFRRIKIRNGGTDWIEMLFRDGMNSSLLANTVDLDLMSYRPVRVYLNGQFWGIYGLREMYNKHYIESHHGVDKDSVDILGDPYGPRSQVREGDSERYDEMVSFLNSNSLSNNDNYKTIQEFIDLDQYLNYHISQIYLANYDWPGNNVRIWRDRNGGKFRWMLYDTDASSGFQSWSPNVANPEHNTVAHMLNTQNVGGVPGFVQWPNGPESTFLFRKMMENQDFKNEFVQRTCTFRELIFSPNRVLPMVDSMESLIRPEMGRHISKWLVNDDLGNRTSAGGSLAKWNLNLASYKRFFTERYLDIFPPYQSSLNLSGRFELTVNYSDTTKGDVVLHENEMKIPFNYQAEYFQSVPIKIIAIPHEGYFFSHWLETGETNPEIQFESEEDAALTPIFTNDSTNIIPPPPPDTTKDADNLDFKIYPNPAQDQLTIELPESENFATLVMYDAWGRIVLKENFSQKKNIVEIITLSAGLYFVKVEALYKSITQKVIVL